MSYQSDSLGGGDQNGSGYPDNSYDHQSSQLNRQASDDQYPDSQNNYDSQRRSRTPPGAYDQNSERRPRGGSNMDDNTGDGTTLYISKLNLQTTESTLLEIFNKYGHIAKATLVVDPHTRDSRGFAFITYENSADADRAIADCNGLELESRNIVVEKSRRSRPRTPTPGRYIGSKPRNYDPRYNNRDVDRYNPDYHRMSYRRREFGYNGPYPGRDYRGRPRESYDRYPMYPPPPPPRGDRYHEYDHRMMAPRRGPPMDPRQYPAPGGDRFPPRDRDRRDRGDGMQYNSHMDRRPHYNMY